MRWTPLNWRTTSLPHPGCDILLECHHADNVTGVVDAERERVTIQEAARRLGVSESAIRKRVQRGTLQHLKDRDGRVYVYLDMGETGEDKIRDASRDELVDTLQDTVRDLRERLDREEEANRENRRIIAGLIERLPPQLEAPPEPRDAPEAAPEPPEGPSPRSDTVGTQEAAEESGTARRPWWLRWFGG